MDDVKRKSHVKRVFQMVNKDTGEVSSFPDPLAVPNLDFRNWIDVLRLDVFSATIESSTKGTTEGAQGQILNHYFTWNDDKNNPLDNVDASMADAQFENANARRRTEALLIKDPDVKWDDPQDPADGVLLWMVDRLKVFMPQGAIDGINQQIVEFEFDNVPPTGNQAGDKPSETRETSPMKIVNNDLNHLKMTNEDEVDDLSQIFAYLVDWDTYEQALIDGTIDKIDLHLTVEFVDKFKLRFGANSDTGIIGQDILYGLTNNVKIEDLYKPGDRDATDANGEPALIRLDPLQVIVNTGLNVVAVEFDEGIK